MFVNECHVDFAFVEFVRRRPDPMVCSVVNPRPAPTPLQAKSVYEKTHTNAECKKTKHSTLLFRLVFLLDDCKRKKIKHHHVKRHVVVALAIVILQVPQSRMANDLNNDLSIFLYYNCEEETKLNENTHNKRTSGLIQFFNLSLKIENSINNTNTNNEKNVKLSHQALSEKFDLI